MTNPIRATRDNLLPGTIWQNAAGTTVSRIVSQGQRTVMVTTMIGNPHTVPVDSFLKLDIWYKVQPIKEAGE